MNVVLIGYRGSGKTSVGRLLAQRLGWEFVDSDVRIVERAGMTIREIFEQRGEAGFRALESETIAELARLDRHVIALGGGAVLRGANVAMLKPRGFVVWLEAPAKTLHERIAGDAGSATNRPALTTAGGTFAEVEAVLAARTPLYAAAADARVTVGDAGATEVASRVLACLPEAIRGRSRVIGG